MKVLIFKPNINFSTEIHFLIWNKLFNLNVISNCFFFFSINFIISHHVELIFMESKLYIVGLHVMIYQRSSINIFHKLYTGNMCTKNQWMVEQLQFEWVCIRLFCFFLTSMLWFIWSKWDAWKLYMFNYFSIKPCVSVCEYNSLCTHIKCIRKAQNKWKIFQILPKGKSTLIWLCTHFNYNAYERNIGTIRHIKSTSN